MVYEVTNNLNEIDFAPATEVSEILQNVRCILTTVQNSVPLFRQFGIDSKFLDSPLNDLTKARLIAEVVNQIGEYEPRCNVKKVECSGDLSGKLQITAMVEI